MTTRLRLSSQNLHSTRSEARYELSLARAVVPGVEHDGIVTSTTRVIRGGIDVNLTENLHATVIRNAAQMSSAATESRREFE
jgi:hypothetical protein